MPNSHWDEMIAGEDYYWDDAGQVVMLVGKSDQPGVLVDDVAAWNPPPEIVARAKAAHFQKPMLLPGRGTPTSSGKPLRGLWPKRMPETPPGEASADDDAS